jgi:carbamoyltransferase
MTNILGISGQERDAAAALVCDGRPVAAIEEEKLSRIRHVGMDYEGGLPYRAIEFCLKQGKIDFKEVDYVAYYIEPEKLFHRQIAFYSSRARPVPDPGAYEAFPSYFVEALNELRQRVRTRRLAEAMMSGRGKFIEVNHHLAHGASAFYASGFDRAAVIDAGYRGDMTATALMTGDGERLTLQAESSFPNSIGLVYNGVTAALGFNYFDDWHKTMWMAPFGLAEHEGLFRDLLSVDFNGLPVVNLEYFEESFRGNPQLSEKFFERAGLKPRGREEPINAKHKNLAASLQSRIEDVLCEIATLHRERTGEEDLCFAGGVALNSLANSAVERRAGFKRLFVQPAAGNAGCCLGAAFYVWHQVLENSERLYRMEHAFLGPRYDEEAIKRVLDNCKISYEYYPTEDRLILEVARLLTQSKIVGWFRGAMEFGPRTLGARSILASPATEIMRDNLNTYIKHREDFRPFSAAVPEERAEEYFEPSRLTEFLQGVSRVREGKQNVIPAALFGDGLVRVQSVSRKTNPSFWKLLMKFGELSGIPVLLNTSFNLFGEPVVSTPREAVRGFYCSGIDCLVIDSFLIKK